MTTHAPSLPADLTARVVLLGRALREAGVTVTPAAAVDGARALAALDVGDREELRLGLCGVMVSRPEDVAAFDACFDQCFSPPSAVGGGALAGPRRELTQGGPPSPRRPPPVTLQNWMKPCADEGGDPVAMRAASDLEGRGA